MDEEEFLNQLLQSNDYDYRKAYLSGEKPSMDIGDRKYHWGSKTSTGEWLKSPNHPTAWKEIFIEKTGVNPDGFGIKNIQEADSVLQKLELPKIQSQLPKEWSKLPEFDPNKENKFRDWMRHTQWFQQLYREVK